MVRKKKETMRKCREVRVDEHLALTSAMADATAIITLATDFFFVAFPGFKYPVEFVYTQF